MENGKNTLCAEKFEQELEAVQFPPGAADEIRVPLALFHVDMHQMCGLACMMLMLHGLDNIDPKRRV